MIQAEPGTDNQLAGEIGRQLGVRRVEEVTGPHDLIAEADTGGNGVGSVLRGIQTSGGSRRLPGDGLPLNGVNSARAIYIR